MDVVADRLVHIFDDIEFALSSILSQNAEKPVECAVSALRNAETAFYFCENY